MSFLALCLELFDEVSLEQGWRSYVMVLAVLKAFPPFHNLDTFPGLSEISELVLGGHELSPVVYLFLKNPGSEKSDADVLQKIVDQVVSQNFPTLQCDSVEF